MEFRIIYVHILVPFPLLIVPIRFFSSNPTTKIEVYYTFDLFRHKPTSNKGEKIAFFSRCILYSNFRHLKRERAICQIKIVVIGFEQIQLIELFTIM